MKDDIRPIKEILEEYSKPTKEQEEEVLRMFIKAYYKDLPAVSLTLFLEKYLKEKN